MVLFYYEFAPSPRGQGPGVYEMLVSRCEIASLIACLAVALKTQLFQRIKGCVGGFSSASQKRLAVPNENFYGIVVNGALNLSSPRLLLQP